MPSESEMGRGDHFEPSQDADPIDEVAPDFIEPIQEDVERPPLTEAAKQTLPIIEVTNEEESQMLADFAAAGKHLQVSDILEHKGIQPDSGFLKLQFGDGSSIIVTTESKYFGGLEE